MKLKKEDLTLRDHLAMDRTNLANERTFLAYFRTFIVFLSSGFAVVHLEALKEIRMIGYGLIVIAPLLLLVGLSRFLYVKKRLKKYYSEI